MPRGHPGQVKQTTKKPKRATLGNLPGPGPGRPKGLPNKVNRDLKEAYLMAANLAGGKEGLIGYLKKQAELENPSAFMTGLSKLLPLMLEGNPDAPLIVERVGRVGSAARKAHAGPSIGSWRCGFPRRYRALVVAWRILRFGCRV